MKKALCQYFLVVKKYMTKYKFYLPHLVYSYSPPKGSALLMGSITQFVLMYVYMEAARKQN